MSRPENHCVFCPQDILVEHVICDDTAETKSPDGVQNCLLLLWCNSCGALGEVRVEKGIAVEQEWHAPRQPRPMG